MEGNILVGQSGGPTAVINSSLAGVYKTARDLGVKKIYGMRYGIEGFISGKYVDMSDYIRSDLDIELLKRTPSSFLGSCRYKLADCNSSSEDYEKIFALLKKLDIRYVLYIGGNDSMDTIQKLSAYARIINSSIRFIGIPKTIDNDLALTDHTPGYGSAAKYIACSVKELIRDAKVYDMKSVAIVEIMGRNSGWLTAASALAEGEDCAGPDMIYLPEKPFDTDKFLTRISQLQKEQGNIVIVVSEGIKGSDGKYISESCTGSQSIDCFGHTPLGGTALTLSSIVGRELGIKSRGIVLSTLQRCAAHWVSRRDITEAFTAGADAVSRAVNGETGVMITFERISDFPYQIKTSSEDINKIANIEKLVPREWILEDDTLKKKEIIRYISPLIIGELPQMIIEGVPRHLYIDR